ncbi:hypothetical protein CAP36_15130 [Chitinophagaceae bacterium IBVUCB2]|nr:hypothetical protein CAP36_15130 [Chitinophagaceae bacterium IBVUCB2]
MKVLGIISSLTDPASRARVLQYIRPLSKEKIFIKPRFFIPDPYADPDPWAYKLKKFTGINEYRFLSAQRIIKRLPLFWEQLKYDLIWQNRLILFKSSFFEKKLQKTTAFDFDDALWVYDGEKQVSEAISASQIVFAGNEYLADFAKKSNNNVFIIPSTIDTDHLFPKKKDTNYFTIGWIGSSFNFQFLEMIRPAVEFLLSTNKDVRFMAVSSAPPPQFIFNNDRMIFKQWSAEEESNLINEFSVGLMPLAENDFTKGKCSYKMLQYMACGVPVIVSPVGMNVKILSQREVGLSAITNEDWIAALQKLKNDAGFYRACQINGPLLIEEDYSVKKYAPVIANLLRKTTK